MDALLAAIASLFSKTENIALLFSFSANIGLAWAHVIWRREERQDRQAMLLTFNELTKALNELKVVIAANFGRPIQ